ncbi:MAG TPA: hypothetical protein VFH88_08590 [Candidatus Krumholzibacteria bacterium]|nr:hypothetical protein [Candidatus Krumholzibacteria bacterium]
MNQRLLAFILIIAVLAGTVALSCHNKVTGDAARSKLVEQFITILPDSLDNNHILEIRQLFYMLYERERLGKVKPETSQVITDKLAAFVRKGHITATQLNYFMSEVGYNTYKDEKKYNLPDGSNDNPVLNPKSAMVSLTFDSTQYDSTFWAGFKKWKKEHPALVDSIMHTDSLR